MLFLMDFRWNVLCHRAHHRTVVQLPIYTVGRNHNTHILLPLNPPLATIQLPCRNSRTLSSSEVSLVAHTVLPSCILPVPVRCWITPSNRVSRSDPPASIAGHNLANSLLQTLPLTHRIILIDAASYAFFPIAALRASVVPGWEDKIILPLNDGTVFPKGSQHRVISGNKVVELKEGTVVLEKEWEGQKEISFAVGVSFSAFLSHLSSF